MKHLYQRDKIIISTAYKHFRDVLRIYSLGMDWYDGLPCVIGRLEEPALYRVGELSRTDDDIEWDE